MGGKNSTTSEPVDLYMDHPVFKNAKSISIDGNPYMEALMGTDEKEYKKWKDTLEKSKVPKQYLLQPIKDQYSSKGLCGSSGTLSLKFDSYPYLLSQQIHNRKGKKKGFIQCEIWYLLYALSCAKKDMVPVFSKIGDVRPNNIFINQKGEVKVSNRYSWPREATNCHKILDGQPTYVAPEELKLLSVGNSQSQDSDKSEIFSIGLTLLGTALLEDQQKLYDIKNFQFDVHQLNNNLNALNTSSAYSDILKGTINNLVQISPQNRLTPAQLWTWISQYQNQILSRENFIINQAPDKLHHQVAQIRKRYGPPPQNMLQSSPGQVTNSALHSSGYSGQKLNFPPPVIRSQLLVQGYPGGPVVNRIPNDANGQIKQTILPNSTKPDIESSSKKNQSPEKDQSS